MSTDKDNGKSKTMIMAESALTVAKKPTQEEKKAEAKRRKDLRNEITHKLRFDVLNRDNHTCQYCGCRVSQKMANGADCELVVDHVVPLDKGGDNELTNLITACWVCNEGKKASMLKQHGFKREYNLDKEKIIAVSETSNFEEFKRFFFDDDNEEARQYMYDLYDQKDERRCMKECKSCVTSGKYYFKSCMQKLYHKVKFNLDDRVGLPREPDKIGESIIESKANTLLCDFCYVSRRCPKYQLGASCAFNFNTFQAEKPEDLLSAVILIQAERCARGSFFEKVDGGAIDKNLSSELTLLGSLIKAKKDLENKPRASVTIHAEGEGNAGVDVIDNLLRQVFAKQEDKPKEVRNTTDADYTEIKENKQGN